VWGSKVRAAAVWAAAVRAVLSDEHTLRPEERVGLVRLQEHLDGMARGVYIVAVDAKDPQALDALMQEYGALDVLTDVLLLQQGHLLELLRELVHRGGRLPARYAKMQAALEREAGVAVMAPAGLVS
jgi:hypothetical protein